jgi:hypothetical protein
MRGAKFDGVVEAVRYSPDGHIAWVRAHERRGAIFSDHLLLDRETLIQRLKSGKRYVTGQRVKYLANTFEIGSPLRLLNHNSEVYIVTEEATTSRDHLAGVPLI